MPSKIGMREAPAMKDVRAGQKKEQPIKVEVKKWPNLERGEHTVR